MSHRQGARGKLSDIRFGSLASISACPQHVRLGGNLGKCRLSRFVGWRHRLPSEQAAWRSSCRRPARLEQHLLGSYAQVLPGATCDIGRSRGGPSRKIHAAVDANGLPVHLGLTPGEAHDNRLCSVLLGALPPQTMLLADRGYDANWIRSLPANKAPGPIFHRSAIAKTQSALAHNCISAVRRIFASSGFGGEYGRLPRIGRPIPHACSLSP